MKKRFRWLAAAITAMALLLAACGGGGNDPVDQAASTQPPASAGEANEPKQQEQVTIKMMANHNQADLSESDKKFVAFIEQATNTKLEIEIPPSTGYNERLQLMLASGEYPDIVFFPDTKQQSFLNAVKDGIVIPVNDYIANAQNLKKYTYEDSLKALKINQDDNIYGIPRTTIVRNDGYWVRKDWLDNVGIELPEDGAVTIDELTDIFTKFTKDDPDRNGKNDTYGFGHALDANKVLQPLFAGAFGALGWQKSSGGEYEYMDEMYNRDGTAYKKALEYTQMLYKSGLLDPDSTSNDANTQRDRFWRGVTGVAPGFAGQYTGYLDQMKQINPNVELTYLFIKNEQGEVQGAGFGSGLWGFWAITSTSKNPQRAVDVLDYWLSDEAWPVVIDGFEGPDFTMSGGSKQFVKNAAPAPVRKNTMRRAGDILFSITPGTSKEVIDKITPWLDRSVETVVRSQNLDFVPEISKQPKYMDYQKKWQETIMKIVLNAEPVSKFDELLEGWYQNDGESYVKEMNAYIQSIQDGK